MTKTGAIGDLTSQALLKIIDLERYYTRYEIIGSKVPKYSFGRYFLLQQAASALLLADNVAVMAETGRNLDTPANVSLNVIKRATRAGLISVVFQGGSSAIELTANGLLALKNRRNGFSPGSARKEVLRRMNEIDAILEQRDELIGKAQHPEMLPIYKAEGDVLRYLRQGCIFEFADIYANVKSYHSSSNVYYALDTTASSLYYAAFVLGLKGFKSPLILRSSSNTAIVGDSLGIVSAPVSGYSYRWLYRFYHRRLEKEMKEKFYNTEAQTTKAINDLKSAVVHIDPAMAKEVGSVQSRLTAYRQCANHYDNEGEQRQIDLLRNENVALQSMVAGPIIVSSFLAQDILSDVAAYKDLHNLDRSNKLAFQGTIPVTVTGGAALGLSSLSYLYSKHIESNLRKKDSMPEQIMHRRLQALDKMDQLFIGP